MGRKNLISLEKAQELIHKKSRVLQTEKFPVARALGRIIADDLYSPISQPPFARSAMDGYALTSGSIEKASKENPARLKVAYKIFSGQMPLCALTDSEAARIMTGAPIPDGADCVVPQEDTDFGENAVSVYAPVKKGQYICPIGEDFKKGELILPKGIRLDSYALAVASAAGISDLRVYKKPRVAIVSTGDELCLPCEKLPDGKVYGSSLIYFSSRCEQLGFEVVFAKIAGDDIEKISAAILEASSNPPYASDCCGMSGAGSENGGVDLIVTTGGVSVGQMDLLPQVLGKLGAEVVFNGISLKPGMPTMAACLDKTLLLCLSGNPYSAIAVFESLVGAFLAKCCNSPYSPKRENALISGGFPKSSPSRRLIRGTLMGGKVRISPAQGNGQLLSGIGSNCMVDIPAGSPTLKDGDVVEVMLLEKPC